MASEWLLNLFNTSPKFCTSQNKFLATPLLCLWSTIRPSVCNVGMQLVGTQPCRLELWYLESNSDQPNVFAHGASTKHPQIPAEMHHPWRNSVTYSLLVWAYSVTSPGSTVVNVTKRIAQFASTARRCCYVMLMKQSTNHSTILQAIKCKLHCVILAVVFQPHAGGIMICNGERCCKSNGPAITLASDTTTHRRSVAD